MAFYNAVSHLQTGFKFASWPPRILGLSLFYLAFSLAFILPLIVLLPVYPQLLSVGSVEALMALLPGLVGVSVYWALLCSFFLACDLFVRATFIHAGGLYASGYVERIHEAVAAVRPLTAHVLITAVLVAMLVGASSALVSMVPESAFGGAWVFVDAAVPVLVGLALSFSLYATVISGREAIPAIQWSLDAVVSQPLRVFYYNLLFNGVTMVLILLSAIPVALVLTLLGPLLASGDTIQLLLGILAALAGGMLVLVTMVFSELICLGSFASAFKEMEIEQRLLRPAKVGASPFAVPKAVKKPSKAKKRKTR